MSSRSSSKVGDTMTTLALGEEDKVQERTSTTTAVGEETKGGSGGEVERPTTTAAGEADDARTTRSVPRDNSLGAW